VELVKIIKQVGVTCVMVTHDQDEAMTMADRIAVMSEGRFLQVGSPSEVYEYPNCRFVADFVGNVNLIDGEVIVDDAEKTVVQSDVCSFFVGHGISGHLGRSGQHTQHGCLYGGQLVVLWQLHQLPLKNGQWTTASSLGHKHQPTP